MEGKEQYCQKESEHRSSNKPYNYVRSLFTIAFTFAFAVSVHISNHLWYSNPLIIIGQGLKNNKK